MTQADEIAQFWAEAAARLGLTPAQELTGPTPASLQPPQAWAFGDDPELADALLALVLSGRKRATSSSYWDYEEEGDPLPQAGELSIVLDSGGHPRAVVRTDSVEIVPFDEVSAEHAEAEGEGSLAVWRQAHQRFFSRSSTRGFDERMPVVCERLTLVHPA